MKNSLLPIAQQGFKRVAFFAAFFVLFVIFDFDFLAFLSFFAALAVVYIYRNPEREMVHFEKQSFISPVDGVVREIVVLEDDEEYGYCVSIEGNYNTVALLRSPFDAEVEDVKVVRGARLARWEEDFRNLNEYAEIIFKNETDKVKAVHILQRSCAPIDIELIKAQQVRQGIRYGLAINAITELYLPKSTRLDITRGNELRAGVSLLGYFR